MTYEDVGAVRRELQRIREMVELPLRHPELFDRLGIDPPKGVLVLGATNRPDALDPALLRAGRFEMELRLPLPDEPARRQILEVHARGKPLAGDVDLDALAAGTTGLAGSDLEALCRRAALLAVRDAVGRGGASAEPPLITREHVERAARELARNPA